MRRIRTRYRLDAGRCAAVAIVLSFWSLVALSCVGCTGVTVRQAPKTVTPPAPIVERVDTVAPVARSCVPDDLEPPPAYPDGDDALRTAQDAADRMMLLAAGRIMRMARLGETETVIAGCR